MSEIDFADDDTLAYIANLEAEIEALKHDIARHVQTCAELATESLVFRGVMQQRC